jgi:hypothetical protein
MAVLRTIGLMLATVVAPGVASAHFIWILSEPAGAKIAVRSGFGEPGDIDVELAGKIRQTEYFVRREESVQPLTLTLDEKQGLYRAEVESAPASIQGICEYGVIARKNTKPFLLRYHPCRLLGSPDAWPGSAVAVKGVETFLAPERKAGAIRLTLTHRGMPVGGREVSAVLPGSTRLKEKTGADGSVTFKLAGAGEYAFFASAESAESGRLMDQAYESIRSYATLTFALTERDCRPAAASAKPMPPSAAASAEFVAIEPLPEKIASFGAAALGNHLYVYGGHIGTAHEHSRENLSKGFRRIDLANGRRWEELPMPRPLQGVALVAAGGKVIRIGGMESRNAKDDEEDMHSVADVAAYDPATKAWTNLPALPAGRSSHDAAVDGNRVFVAGGWTMRGASAESVWCDSALMLDLDHLDRGWTELAKPPMRRRALNVAVYGGRLFVIGGLNEKGKVTSEVDVLDLRTGAWAKGPVIPGGERIGFGAAAIAGPEGLFVSLMDGAIHRLDPAANAWKPAGQLKVKRFLHRLALANGRLLAIAGASKAGHLDLIESLPIERSPSVPSAN